ncbi:MAG: MFS transporter [Bacteroidaceae bacterium]|nr:MFS transporter [Bacteroidaceae bacterium]MBQ4038984.1 MFS transporter [Bacteroidaceae bacterium]
MKDLHKGWQWIPTLYFAEGLPYFAVTAISVILYKSMGLSNSDIALYTSWFYLPWVIKPFWSPIVDMLSTRRKWIIATQLIMGAALASIAFTIPLASYLQWTICLFWLIAFSSATHDIAADGFYMLGLDQEGQSFFAGIRSTFYRIATIFGQGVLIYFAGKLETLTGNVALSWSITFGILCVILTFTGIYHSRMLPTPQSDTPRSIQSIKEIFSGFKNIIFTFFKKPGIIPALLFMLLFRLPEAQLVKLINPFLMDAKADGGLAMSVEQIGITYGTIGVIGLIIGGILGGICISRGGLKKWLWPMVMAISIPDLVYVYLSYAQPDSLSVINSCIFIEQLGYGFGFTAYMLYLIYFAQGEYPTAHYAISTAFMALGMMLPGMISGYIQESLGYFNFFVWVIICCAATFIVSAMLKIDPTFGKKQ